MSAMRDKKQAPKPKQFEASVRIVTWNVGGKYPEEIDLTDLLGLTKNSKLQNDPPDFYVIGLQEVNTQPLTFLIDMFREDPWTQKFKDVLKFHDYILVRTENLQGLLIMLFSKRKHILNLRMIDDKYVRTGFGGLWGNKGAVSIRLSFYGCAVCLVNAHLAAHDHQLDERIEDYYQIVKEMAYDDKLERYKLIFDHDYVFWFGDLNFRLSVDVASHPQSVCQLINRKCLSQLLEHDQLCLIRAQKRAFYELDEMPPNFNPTFKFERGSSQYDMKRRPAWTDRILHKVNNNPKKDIVLYAKQSTYDSHPSYNISDHKPVTANFIINVAEDLDQKMVEFVHIPVWYIGEDNIVQYVIPEDCICATENWIGLFRSNFSSLNDYVAYEYTRPLVGGDITVAKSFVKRQMHLEFSENIELDDGEFYNLLFFYKNVKYELIGMSNTFRAEKRPPSPRFEAVD